MRKAARTIRCAIYDRVSTEIQAKEGLSLEAQRQALTDYAVAHGYQIVGYYNDEGLTARKKMQNRKDLLRLLKDVEADKVDLILVTKLDRWFRNIKDYYNTQAILEAHNCNWKTIFEEYDTSTSNGRFAINIMLSVNENECDRTSERIKTVFSYKRGNREHINGKLAYGYSKDANKQYIKDPKTEPIVNEIFEHYFKTYSKHDTVMHILNKYDADPNCPSYNQIVRILKNEVYTGTLYGIDGYCPAYITKEQHKKIKEISTSKQVYHQVEPFLFSSTIVCPVCGRKMSGFVARQKLKNGTNASYKRYRCSAKFKEYHGGACITESVIENYLISHIMDQLHMELLELRQQEKLLKLSKPDKSSGIKAEIERLNNMYQKGRIKEDYYDDQYAILSEKLAQCVVPDNTAALIQTYEAIEDIFAEGWQEMYDKLDISHKKSFWKEVLSEVYVDKDTHKICGFKFRV